jgi:hypothetical protein
MHSGRLVDDPHGGLLIWRMPEKGRMYVVGSDTAEGVRGGDYSAAEVLDAESMEQCAVWHCQMRPSAWGYACARLAYFFNQAPLAFETHPSPYGLAAYDAADRYGYEKLWMQRSYDELEQRWSLKKGWRRSPGSTSILMDRVREALIEGVPIREEALLDELAACKLNMDPGKADGAKFGQIMGSIRRGEHDDRIIAYGIALLVRDDAWAKGEVTLAPKRVEDMADAYWQKRLEEGMQEGMPTPATVYEEPWNGL